MTEPRTSEELSLALLADHRDERTEWLVRVLEEGGYAVLRERAAVHARERARTAQPELIIIAADLPDTGGIELCRMLRGDPRISTSTPILCTLAEATSRAQRLEALRAGAWDCIVPPHDRDELLVKLNAYVQAKREADRARAEGLTDSQTGLYNRQGLARRARELASQAFREHAALACVVLALDFRGGFQTAGEEATAALMRGARTLQATARRSDVIGRLSAVEFAVLAPGTDAAGARQLAERLAGPLQAAVAHEPGILGGVRFGYEAVANVGYSPIEPVDLLVRASTAVRTGAAEAGGLIRRFDQGAGQAAPAPQQ